jgi:maltokinase
VSDDVTSPDGPGASGALLPDGVHGLLGDHLAQQRWYAGTDRPTDASITVVDARILASRGDHHLHWAVLEVDGLRYQLLLGERPGGETAEFLAGREAAVVGSPASSYFYDATYDAELMLAFFELVTGSPAERVRPVGAEQSNTSLVFDDRTIVKIYRRLLEGANPDIEVTTALVAAGFDHVAEPVGTWRADGIDLAFAQRFLAGGSEGWALALTSLRDLFHSESGEPADAGGDFSGAWAGSAPRCTWPWPAPSPRGPRSSAGGGPGSSTSSTAGCTRRWPATGAGSSGR